MRLIAPSVEILDFPDKAHIFQKLETAARTCYQSDGKTQLCPICKGQGSVECAECSECQGLGTLTGRSLLERIIKRGHHSVLEHVSMTVRVICDRGVTHEFVRHRVGVAFSQESTHFCNYCNDSFGNEIKVIIPSFWAEDDPRYRVWLRAMQHAEEAYMELIQLGAIAKQARTVLPNSLKAELIVTGNVRAWRHFFSLRAVPTAHPQMQEIACMIQKEFQQRVPVLFDSATAME